jgi:hypothetical protein
MDVQDRSSSFYHNCKGVAGLCRLIFLQLSAQRKPSSSREGGDGPCRLLKLRQIEPLGVRMKGVLPWLVRLARRTGIIDFLSCLILYKNIIFLTAHFFTLLIPIAPQPISTGAESLWAFVLHSHTYRVAFQHPHHPNIFHLLINTHYHVIMLRSPFCDFVPSSRSLSLVSDTFSLLNIHQKRQTCSESWPWSAPQPHPTQRNDSLEN